MRNFLTLRGLFLVIPVLIILGGPANTSVASEQARPDSEQEPTSAELQESIAETYALLKRYTIEQRDEAMAAMEQQLERLDARISELQDRLDNDWEDMSRTARKQTRETLDRLRRQREEVAEWYGGMRHSSAKAWEDVKQGFAESYANLVEAFEKAREDLEAQE